MTAPGICIIAMTVTGEMWVWRVAGGDKQRDGKGGVQRLVCVTRATIMPLVASMRCRAVKPGSGGRLPGMAGAGTGAGAGAGVGAGGGGSGTGVGTGAPEVTVTVERLTLSKFGAPVAYLRSRNAEGGDWQAFMFSSELQTWVRLADLRHVMSRAFKVLPEFAVAAAASERERAAGGGTGGQDVLQSEAAYSGGLTTRCVDPFFALAEENSPSLLFSAVHSQI